MKAKAQSPTQGLWQQIEPALRAEAAGLCASQLARRIGISPELLDQVLLEHRHQPAAQALADSRARAVTRALLTAAAPIETTANQCGFSSPVALDRALRGYWGLDARSIAGLRGSTAFEVTLPARYRIAETLAYLARDPDSNNVQREDRSSVTIALHINAEALRVKLSLHGNIAYVNVSTPLARSAVLPCLEAMRRLLGLAAPTLALARRASQHAQVRRLVKGRTGLTVHQTASTWDALVWAVLGQQISLRAAYSLLRTLSAAAGLDAGEGLRTLPAVARVADMNEAQLRACKLSRAKATTLRRLAAKVAAGELDLEALESGSAVVAGETLLAQHGIGPWTANYVMMRGLGFADCAPVGDAGLRRALKQFFDLERAPTDSEMGTLMAPFTPHRSLATFHLWRGFDDALPTS